VADEEAGIDAETTVDAGEVLGERGPGPRAATLERFDGDAFHHRHHPLDVPSVVGPERCDGEAAIPPENGGDAVEDRRVGGGVPQELGVVVGVEVHESRADDPALGVDRPGGGLVGAADGGDPSVAHADIGDGGRRTGAVDHGAAPEQQIEHVSAPR